MEFWFLKPVVEFLSDPKQISETAFNKVFQIEVTKPSIVKTIERAFGGTVLGLDATKSVLGKDLIERINKLENIDLLETLELDTLFDEKEKYNRNDVIAILSQSSKFEELKKISIYIKTSEDAIQKATEQARIEATKIAERNSKDFSKQLTEVIRPLNTQVTKMANVITSINKLIKDETKQRKDDIKQLGKQILDIQKTANVQPKDKKQRKKKTDEIAEDANATTIVIVDPNNEESKATNK